MPGDYWKAVGEPIVLAGRHYQIYREPGHIGFRTRPTFWSE